MKLWSGDTGFREMTTKSNVRPILIVNGSVLLRISTSTHRSSRSTHSLEVLEKSQYSNCEMGILGCERQQQRRAFDRPLQLLVQLCFGLRRGNLENFAEAIPANSNCEMGILGCERQQQRRAFDRPLQLLVQLCFGLRRGNLENFAEAIPANSNCEVGILGYDRKQQRRAFDRPLQLLVQLCFGLRRGNLENFAEAIRASINEE
ncbi:hypothetical protein V1477_018623 [Vespula maculifrons]|uniref:Uncharacterized protein n=1 Tax=Vespula maculifrons TaxID=7453 RepID=A0ABD2AWS7_VESMC